jgi:hypothetical protein
MYLINPLPAAQGNYKYTVVAVEYFTKWIEAKPLANVTSEAVRKFFWQNIICRLGVPKELTVDNGKQFDSDLFKEFCHSIGMKVMFSIYHPQSNGTVEGANGLIFSSIKKCMFNRKKGKWVDELPKGHMVTQYIRVQNNKVHSIQTTLRSKSYERRRAQKQKPKGPITREEAHPPNEASLIELDILQAANNLSKYQQETKKWRDKKVVRRDISMGDWVLKRKPNAEIIGKLHSKLETTKVTSRSILGMLTA